MTSCPLKKGAFVAQRNSDESTAETSSTLFPIPEGICDLDGGGQKARSLSPSSALLDTEEKLLSLRGVALMVQQAPMELLSKSSGVFFEIERNFGFADELAADKFSSDSRIRRITGCLTCEFSIG
mmetsp:Transcript_21813/g.32102  ORF Transcript_21813/g.32102 Transcript_21813/m.32102 type:complete len:125 (-) Transcript_21813:1075-1449(-)